MASKTSMSSSANKAKGASLHSLSEDMETMEKPDYLKRRYEKSSNMMYSSSKSSSSSKKRVVFRGEEGNTVIWKTKDGHIIYAIRKKKETPAPTFLPSTASSVAKSPVIVSPLPTQRPSAPSTPAPTIVIRPSPPPSPPVLVTWYPVNSTMSEPTTTPMSNSTQTATATSAVAATESRTSTPQLLVTQTPTGSPPTTDSPTFAPSACGANQMISQWWLVDADMNVRLKNIRDNEVLNLAVLERMYNTGRFTIEAETSPPVVGSVRFTDNFNAGVTLANDPPYALAGQNSGDYIALNLVLGDWTVTAEPYCFVSGQGEPGQISTLRFLVNAA